MENRIGRSREDRQSGHGRVPVHQSGEAGHRREPSESRRGRDEGGNGSNDFFQLTTQEFRRTNTVFAPDEALEDAQWNKLYKKQKKAMNELIRKHKEELQSLPKDYPYMEEKIDVQRDEIRAMQLKHQWEQQALTRTQFEQRSQNAAVNNADFTILNQSDLNRWDHESRDNLSLSGGED
jgi:hypothetical protein